jgi:hypothetical protein
MNLRSNYTQSMYLQYTIFMGHTCSNVKWNTFVAELCILNWFLEAMFFSPIYCKEKEFNRFFV